MLSLFILGIALAVGHHCYYRSLDGTKVVPTALSTSAWDTDRQEWKIRFGTGFAFVAKTCLATSIAIAYTQHVWASCKRKAYSIAGLDALFSATSDVFAFANLELTFRAKLAALLAALVWLLPLSALITPATLTVINIEINQTRPGEVPQLKFPRLPRSDSPILDGVSDNPYTWRSEPSALLTRSTFAAAASMSILSMPPGTPNSTYVMDFNGPSLKCDEPDDDYLIHYINETVNAVGEIVGGDEGVVSFYTAFTPVFSGYADDSGNATDFVAFAKACVLGGDRCRFSQGYVLDKVGVPGRGIPLVISLGKTYTCALRNTSYSVRFRSSTEQTSLSLISFQWLEDSEYASSDVTYAAVAMAVVNILTGTYYLFAEAGLGSARTSIGATAILGLFNEKLDKEQAGQVSYVPLPPADIALTRNKTLSELVEELSRNVTLSLFSSTRLHANTTYHTNINYESKVNVYAYNAHNLWTAYGVAIAVTFLSLGVGFYALYTNGVSYRASFSTIMATTRNHVLDDIMIGSSLGADPIRANVMRTKLKFGVFDKGFAKVSSDGRSIDDRRGALRAGFALEGQVGVLKKGQQCY